MLHTQRTARAAFYGVVMDTFRPDVKTSRILVCHKAGLALARVLARVLASLRVTLNACFHQRRWSDRPCVSSVAVQMCTYVPDSEEDKRRREQQREHVTKGRECERHFCSLGSVSRFLARLEDDAGSFATDLRFVS